MEHTLRVRKALKKLRVYLMLVAVLVAAVAVGFALWGPVNGAESRGASALVGGLGGLIFTGLTWFFSTKVTSGTEIKIGWLAADYLLKLVMTIGILAFAKAMVALASLTVGLILVVAIFATMLAQVAAFASPK